MKATIYTKREADHTYTAQLQITGIVGMQNAADITAELQRWLEGRTGKRGEIAPAVKQ